MRTATIAAILASLLNVLPVSAEVTLDQFELKGSETRSFHLPFTTPQVLHAALANKPQVGDRDKVIEIMQAHGMGSDCSGSGCRGVWTLFCPKNGFIDGTVKNHLSTALSVTLSRFECDGADSKTMSCPRDPKFAARACAKF